MSAELKPSLVGWHGCGLHRRYMPPHRLFTHVQDGTGTALGQPGLAVTGAGPPSTGLYRSTIQLTHD